MDGFYNLFGLPCAICGRPVDSWVAHRCRPCGCPSGVWRVRAPQHVAPTSRSVAPGGQALAGARASN